MFCSLRLIILFNGIERSIQQTGRLRGDSIPAAKPLSSINHVNSMACVRKTMPLSSWHALRTILIQTEQINPRRIQIMKKTVGTAIVAAVVVLMTATFSFAEFAAAGAGNFPYFQLGALIIGGMVIISMKHKFSKMYTNEAVGAFALYTVLMAIFTNPVIDAIKNLVS